MGYYARRTDSNSCQIIDTLHACGWYWLDLSRAGFGAPDGIAVRGGVVRFCELKDGSKSPSQRKLTPREQAVRDALAAAGVEVLILATVDEAAGLR